MHTIKDIEESVCLAFGVTSWDLHNASRKRKFARPRQTVFYLAREFHISLTKIAAAFGKHHTTVMSGADNVAALIAAGHLGMSKRLERTREILATITPYRARPAELVAGNNLPPAPERPQARPEPGDRRRRVIAFAQSHASSRARP